MFKYSMNYSSRRKKYRHILIAIIVIIIVLLIGIITVVKIKNTKKDESAKNVQTNETKENEEAMLIELDNKKKEEERQKEKEEEENATGVIYLTFDDGPSSDITPQILDVLDSKNVKATFFVVHFSEKNAELVKREANSGHTVALHGYTHTYSEVYQSADSCLDNFKKIQEQVYETIGQRPNIIRFPGGSSNTISKKYCPGVMTEVTRKSIRRRI